MKPSNVGKVRRKVIVRGKKKTYSRTMMVKAQNLGMKALRHELKQEQLNKHNMPMEKRLLSRAIGALRSKLGRKTESRMYSMNHDGPNAGSTASWFALSIGASKHEQKASREAWGTPTTTLEHLTSFGGHSYNHPSHQGAWARREAGAGTSASVYNGVAGRVRRAEDAPAALNGAVTRAHVRGPGNFMIRPPEHGGLNHRAEGPISDAEAFRRQLSQRYHTRDVHQVWQNPNKWTR